MRPLTLDHHVELNNHIANSDRNQYVEILGYRKNGMHKHSGNFSFQSETSVSKFIKDVTVLNLQIPEINPSIKFNTMDKRNLQNSNHYNNHLANNHQSTIIT